MSMKPRPMVVGNWKMNGMRQALKEAHSLNDLLKTARKIKELDIILCPPATLLMKMTEDLGEKSLNLGAQDCHVSSSGPHTGDISAEMLADAGASSIIIGHSERRLDHAETDTLVKTKQTAIHRAGLTAIICVGETVGQRFADLTLTVVQRQLERSLGPQTCAKNTVIAYEPVWAIGTGVTPTPQQVVEVHCMIRNALIERFGEDGALMRILYGGSVKPQNAKDLLSIRNVDGALVGGASLKSSDFFNIISAYNS